MHLKTSKKKKVVYSLVCFLSFLKASERKNACLRFCASYAFYK